MSKLLLLFQFLVSILLTGAILIQSKGTGFSRSWKATSSTRRGLERLLFRSTFVLTAIFIIVSLLQILI